MGSGGPVDWAIAERVGCRLAGDEPLSRSYHAGSLATDIAELVPVAEDLVYATTGLRSLSGPARAVVVDRADWVRANIGAFQRLLGPMLERVAERSPSRGPLRSATRTIAGAEVGALLGWMSKRVLGQYDLLVGDAAAGDAPAGDTVYLVGPNVLALEKRYAFPPRQFRLWLALHEVTHRAQFTGVPWMRAHYLDLIRQSVELVDPDPQRLLEVLRAAAANIRRDGRRAFDDGGLAVVLASPAQRLVLDQVGGLMALLEGHGDVTMDRAGVAQVPSAERFSRVLSERRRNSSPVIRLVQKLTGIEAKLNQYELGEAFISAIERVDATLIERCWERPENLPSLAEIKTPAQWLDRMEVAASRAG